MFDADSDFNGGGIDLDTECTPMLQSADSATVEDFECRLSLYDEQTRLIDGSPQSSASQRRRGIGGLTDTDDVPPSVRHRTTALGRSETPHPGQAAVSSLELRLPTSSSYSLSAAAQTVVSNGKQSDDSAFYDDDSCVDCDRQMAYLSHCHCACQSGDYRQCTGNGLTSSDIDGDDDDDDSVCSCCCNCNNDSLVHTDAYLDLPVAVTSLSSLAPMSLLAAGQSECYGQDGGCAEAYESLRRCMMSSVVALQMSKSTSSPLSSSSVVSLCRSKSFTAHRLASVARSGVTDPLTTDVLLGGRRSQSASSLPASIPQCTCGLDVGGGLFPGQLPSMDPSVGQQVSALTATCNCRQVFDMNAYRQFCKLLL